jgi:sulfite oxidase
VDGLVAQALNLSMTELKENFSQHTVTCALQCAGNRRHSMRTRIKEVQGIDWFDAAILNAQWTGPLLRDILIRAGVQDGQNTDLHVHLASTRTKVQDDEWYGSSIPLAMALDEGREAVLALKVCYRVPPRAHTNVIR